MSERPTGTVTFVFTDVEGSTRLLREIGDKEFARAVERQRATLREIFARHGATEVDAQGDSFFFALPSAPAATAAAVEVHAALSGEPVRVRIGIHTGTPHVTDSGYIGIDVHRAARIAAAAHGGQTLLSAATAALVADATLHDLGKHRFKDLPQPEHVYQLGDAAFPPLRSLYRTNLPVPATAFLGRERELAEISAALVGEDVRLLTLTGAGGTGKTRLALQAAAETADEFDAGVWCVMLASLRDAKLLLPTIAAALDGHEGDDALGAIADALAPGRSLLVLDNVEQLLPSVVAELAYLQALPGVTLLVTSRERLQATAEHVYRVLPMTTQDAADLFCARAGQQGVALAVTHDVQELCTRLDRLPLAIELAAARAGLFTPSQLVARVGERLDLLKGARDADPRQRTLRATLDWSYELLDERERRLFERFSVFSGGCTYDAAEQVCDADADTLQSLIDKSLLRRRDAKPEPRYWMLETIREYAALRHAAAGDGADTRRRHTMYYLAAAERAGTELAEGDATRWRWLENLDADVANVRAMLASLAADGAHAELVRAGAALWRYWVCRDLSEGLPWLEDAAARPAEAPMRARLLHGLAVVAARTGKLELAHETAAECLALHLQLGDERDVAESLLLVGMIAGARGELEQARTAFENAVEFARDADDRALLAGGLVNLGYQALQERAFEEAATHSLEAASLWRELHRHDQVVVSELNRASARLEQGETREARSALRSALDLAAELGDKDHIAYCLDGLAAVEAARGDARRGAVFVGAAEAIRETTGTIREPYERHVGVRTEAALRSELGGEYDALVAEGRAAGTEHVVAIALSRSSIGDVALQS